MSDPSRAAAARPSGESVATLTTTLLPADTNLYGNAFGGHLMALVDKTASITAFRHARCNVVTASIDRVDFVAPVRLGDIMTVRSRLNHVGRTSMEVEVTLTTEDRITGVELTALSAFLTFVAIDEAGRPAPVPPLVLLTEDDRARDRAGAARAGQRRAERGPRG